MASATGSYSISDLADKLAAVEKRLAELELKPNGTSLTAEALALKNKADEEENSSKSKANKNQADKEEEGHDPRVKVVISRRNPETGEPIEEDSKLKTLKDDDREKRAFILRKNVFDSKLYQLENSSEIEIISLHLWDLLKEHLGYYPYHLFRDSPVTLYSPFEPLVNQFEELQAAATKAPKDDKDKEAREDLMRLLNIISGGASGDARLDKYFKMRPNYKKKATDNRQEPETIQFTDLWTVFPPGTLVYGRPFQNEHQVFVVKDNRFVWPYKDQRRNDGREYAPWLLDAWSYDWKDGTFRRTDFTLVFESFDGHLPLTSLSYFPFELHPDRDAIRAELVERGKKFREICEAKEFGRLFEYRGNAISEQQGFSGMKLDDEGRPEADFRSNSSYGLSDIFSGRILERRRTDDSAHLTAKSVEVRSRVMVDYDSYFQYGPSDGRNGSLNPGRSGTGCACSDCETNEGLKKRYRASFDSPEKEWVEEQYLISPPRVLGYILGDKRWAQLQVTHLEGIHKDNKKSAASFERLKLVDDPPPDRPGRNRKGKRDNKSTKNLLMDLILSHTTTSLGESDERDEDDLEVDDIIPGKGKGLVILLYGPPGVGKTSTAETIAIATRKPLFSVSVADVGTKAKNVESNLSRIFALATKWQAILLIDEADVFLESRGRGNKIQPTDKNALVSVFLRVLEYYQGIMFLTTNQIANFDVAIPSRIHVAIRYETLKPNQMESIFRGFLDKLHNRGLVEDYDSIIDWIEDVVYKEGPDGRQIRNTVTTALGLARAEKKAGEGKGKLTMDHMKRAFDNVSAFKRDFNTQMQRYKDSQEKMIA